MEKRQSNNLSAFIYKEGIVQKINGTPVYWLGHSIGQLQNILSNASTITISSVISNVSTCRQNLNYFMEQEKGVLPLSITAANQIIAHLDRIFTEDNVKNNIPISLPDISVLNFSIINFQFVFNAELPSANFFYVTPKRAYDMSRLISRGESILSDVCLQALTQSKQEIINDIQEATKCYAFDLPTAVGFHIYRVIEAIIVKDYFPVLGVLPQEWSTNKNLGHYITILEKKNVGEKITAILKHLKDHYRNPIMHPEEFWNSDTAEAALMFAISVISVLSQDIQTRTKERGTPLLSTK